MKKYMKNEKGFTLIEMMIVLLIISVLILITIPNVTKHSATIDDKGCDAYVKTVQGLVQTYKMDTNSYPDTIDILVTEGYIEADVKCPNGDVLEITTEGVVKITDKEAAAGA
jgi:competence protein ComGC